MKIRVKAVFGKPRTEIAAIAVDGLVCGEWIDVQDDDVYDVAVEQFLKDHPECNSWNISIEEQE